MFFFSSRRRHTRLQGDWSSDVCSSDLSGVRGQGSDVDASQTQNSELKTFPPSPIPHPPSPIPLLDQTWLAHPALFVVEYALAQLWMSWGVRPRAIIGHSIGGDVAPGLACAFTANRPATWINPEQATDPAYGVRHLRQTVRFADGLHTLLADFSGALLEVGPGQTLGVLARQQCDREADQVVCSSLRYAQEDES